MHANPSSLKAKQIPHRTSRSTSKEGENSQTYMQRSASPLHPHIPTRPNNRPVGTNKARTDRDAALRETEFRLGDGGLHAWVVACWGWLGKGGCAGGRAAGGGAENHCECVLEW